MAEVILMSSHCYGRRSIEVLEGFGGDDVVELAARTCSRLLAAPTRRSELAKGQMSAVSSQSAGDSSCAMLRRYAEMKQWLAVGCLNGVWCAARRG